MTPPPDAGGGSDGSGGSARSTPGDGPWARWWWLTLVAASVPLVLGLARLSQRTWYPVGDLGYANLRYLSFWSHPPLVGTAGRIAGEGGVQGNHPGPAQFWLSWPVWRVLGGSSWALNGAVAVTNLVGAAVAAVCARRVAGPAAAGAVGAVATVLVAGFGPEVMLQPWNPSMPLMWFLALVVASWGAVSGHRWMLPVVAFCASYVVQCHAGYAPLALSLCAVAGGTPLVAALRHPERARQLRLLAPWLAAAGGVAGVMWAPPVIDELTRDPGNLTILLHSFSHPDADYIGPVEALHLTLLQLDPTGGPLRGTERLHGVPGGGIAVLTAWVLTGVAAGRRLPAVGRRLDVVLLVALVAGWLSIGRIFGEPYVYLFKWMWVLCGLLVVATAVHAACWWDGRRAAAAGADPDGRGRADRRVPAAVAVLTLIGLVAGVVRFAPTEVSGEPYSETVAGVIGPTSAALDPDADYLVRWDDPAALGAVGFGVVLELERRGFEVGVDERFSAAAEPHRVMAEEEADAVLWVVSGPRAIAAARDRPGARSLVRFDVRTAEERRRHDLLVDRVSRRLAEEGFDDQARSVRTGGNLFAVLLSAQLPDDVVDDIGELIDLFLPTAVVVTPAAP